MLGAVKLYGINSAHSAKDVDVQTAALGGGGGAFHDVAALTVERRNHWSVAKLRQPVAARRVRVVVRSNHGGDRFTAYQEVGFCGHRQADGAEAA